MNNNNNNCMQFVALFVAAVDRIKRRKSRVEAYKRKWRVEILELNVDSSLIDGA